METETVQKSTKALQAAEDTALQRYQWIAPLLEEGLNPSERAELRRKTAEMAELSVRSIYRYEELYKEGGFKSLFPNYKDGPKLPIGKNGAKAETHLLVIIDDCTRYVVHSAFYLNETEENMEMGLRDAITRYGLFDRYSTDNGSCFISTDLKKALGRLGITHTKSRPHKPKGRGKVEKFNQMADVFIDEVKLDNPRTL